jgi:hypothetical protein
MSGKDAFRRERRGRRMRHLAPLAAAVLGTAVVAGPAQAAGIGQHGPLDPAFGNYPAWYQDDIGQRLEPCLDGPQCLATLERPKPDAPVEFPNNFPGEMFWFNASATIGDPVAPDAELVMAQEGAFGGDSEGVVDGEQVGFGRLRIRVFQGLEEGRSYRVTHPYGVQEFVAGPVSRQINFTDDTGCTDLVPGPCSGQTPGFAGLAGSQIGPSFLQWDTRVSRAPAGFIGDSTVAHEVVGSPFDTNYFRVEELSGPGGTPVKTVMNTTKFSVQGKLAPGASPVAWLSAPRSADAGSGLKGTATAPSSITLANSGGGDLAIQAITLAGANAGEFAIQTGGCPATLAPGASCNVTFTATPGVAGARSAQVTVQTNAGPRVIALSVTGTEPAPAAGAAAGGAAPAPAATVAAPRNAPAPVTSRRTATPGVAQQSAAPTLGALRVSLVNGRTRLSLREARRSGIRLSFRMPAQATVARVVLLRGGKRVGRRTVSGQGIKRVRFTRGLRRGSYVVRVQVGRSLTTLGPAKTKRIVIAG